VHTVNNKPCFNDAMKKGLYSGGMKLSSSYGREKVPVAEKFKYW